MDTNFREGFELLTKQIEELLPRYERNEYVFPNGSIERWYSANDEHVIIRYSKP